MVLDMYSYVLHIYFMNFILFLFIFSVVDVFLKHDLKHDLAQPFSTPTEEDGFDRQTATKVGDLIWTAPTASNHPMKQATRSLLAEKLGSEPTLGAFIDQQSHSPWNFTRCPTFLGLSVVLLGDGAGVEPVFNLKTQPLRQTKLADLRSPRHPHFFGHPINVFFGRFLGWFGLQPKRLDKWPSPWG